MVMWMQGLEVLALEQLQQLGGDQPGPRWDVQLTQSCQNNTLQQWDHTEGPQGNGVGQPGCYWSVIPTQACREHRGSEGDRWTQVTLSANTGHGRDSGTPKPQSNPHLIQGHCLCFQTPSVTPHLMTPLPFPNLCHTQELRFHHPSCRGSPSWMST